MEAGGKRLRPRLLQLTSLIGPRYDPLLAASLAAAVELLHSATLVHDDYVDESTHRRGRPTVAAAEGAERAIAVGDYYFAKATRMIAEIGPTCSDLDDGRGAGGHLRFSDRTTSPCVEHSQAIAAHTCASSRARRLRCCGRLRIRRAALRFAAEVVAALKRYGELLGIAFQMPTTSSTSVELGQAGWLDIRQRVLSLPLIYAPKTAKLARRCGACSRVRLVIERSTGRQARDVERCAPAGRR